MSLLYTFILDAFEDHLSNLSVSVTFNGKQYEALPAEVEITPSLDLGGVTDSSDSMVIVRIADFVILPKVGMRISVNNEDLRVSAIFKQAGHPLATLALSGVSER